MKSPFKKEGVSLIFFALLFSFALLLLPPLILQTVFREVIRPETSVASIRLDYKTPSEVKTILTQAIDQFKKTPRTFIAGDKQISFTPEDLNVLFDIDQTLSLLPIVQIKNQLIPKTFAGFWEKTEVPLYVNISEEKLIGVIEKVFIPAEDHPLESTLFFDEKGKIQIQEGKKGKEIEISQLKKNIETNFSALSLEPIQIIIQEKNPSFPKDQLENYKQKIEQTLTRRFTLFDNENFFKIPLKDHLDWISFEEIRDISWETFEVGKKLIIQLNKEKLRNFIEKEIAQKINVPVEGIKIYKNHEEKIIFEGKAQNGKEVDVERLINTLNFAVNEQLFSVEMPIYQKTAPIEISSDLQALGIKELIGVGHTTFAGSPLNRIHNIKVGVNKFNGALIPPSEKFSFNKHLGPVEAYAGYLEELVIKPEGTIPELGGGLCQVSTTAYRAALYTGLPVLERHPHSYAVLYYAQIGGHGLDATIYPGARDLVFSNDTPGHILIQSYVDGIHAYFKFYGTNDGRKIELEGPYISNFVTAGPTETVETTAIPEGTKKQVERPHRGFDALWHRYVTKNGSTTKETIFSKYQAVPAKILVGVDKPASSSPAPSGKPPSFRD